jgi:glycosyltransferase involved in cell wall biosynthesis
MEESRIGPMLKDTLAYLEARAIREPCFTAEVIVVDDGSPDNTSAQVHRIFEEIKPKRVQVGLIRFPVNQGKGAAISEVNHLSGTLTPILVGHIGI